MTICPFISSGNSVMRCHPMCALLIDGECALAVLAKAKMVEQSSQANEKEADHK